MTLELDRLRAVLQEHLQECSAQNADTNSSLKRVLAWQETFGKRAWGFVAGVGAIFLTALIGGLISFAVQTAQVAKAIPTPAAVAAHIPDRYTATDAARDKAQHDREFRALKDCITNHAKCKELPDDGNG